MARSILRILLVLVALLVSIGNLYAEVGFKYRPSWERYVDPTRPNQRLGLTSSPWDSLALARADSLKEVAIADSLRLIAEETAKDTTSSSATGDTTGKSTTDDSRDTSEAPDVTTTPDEPDKKKSRKEIMEEKRAEAAEKRAQRKAEKEAAKVAEEAEIEEEEQEIPYRPTLLRLSDVPIEIKSELDTATNYIVFRNQLSGEDLPVSGAMPEEAFLQRMLALSDRETWRSSVISNLPKEKESEGSAIAISIPVFKSKRLQRIFGGDQVGLQVTGDISVDGSLRTEKRDGLDADNPNPTSYSFKVDQTQRFHIKGNVGEKVEVEIDQDSERLFEFENNLKVTYNGNDDEIIQKIEAGNVNLSLPGARFVSGSGKHQGLFGFKIESKIGPLKLITIASLDKGEKQTKKIDGGAESSGPRTIKPQNFIRDRYFFLDHSYRQMYRHRRADDLSVHYYNAEDQIINYEVYKSVRQSTENLNAVPGWAFVNPDEVIQGEPTSDREHQAARFLPLRPGTDYELNTDLGYIRLNFQLNDDEIIAVAYQTSNKIVGDLAVPANPETERFTLKLIRPQNPQTTDQTWDLMWRHIYDLGSTGIEWDGFSGKITYATGGDANERKETYEHDQVSNSLLELFWLDMGGPANDPNLDNQIDAAFVNTSRGELEFPDLRPFDPEGWFIGPDSSSSNYMKTDPLINVDGDTLFEPQLYDGSESNLSRLNVDFSIIVEYKNISATYNLGFLVLEGSEEVLLNGQRLNKGTDYTIDYTTGTLAILKREAMSADANVEISWETGQMMQLDTKTVLGLRAEYELWDDSYIGSTLMYRSEKTLEQRIRIGQEPLQNSIWDVNAKLTFKPMFLTRAADALPLYETNEPSSFVIEGEVAQIFPNPNNSNNSSTGDNNGVAYVDDFESVKQSVPLGITRTLWTHSSYPDYDNRNLELWEKQRGRLIWYNPWEQVNITEIWPEREVEAQASRTHVLNVEFQPWWSEWGELPTEEIDRTKSWGGIMRYMGAGFADQSQSKYIEVWLNRRSANTGTIYIDLGQISEDVIPNGKLDTEDRPVEGFPSGDGICSSAEDTGIDTTHAEDPSDLINVNGLYIGGQPQLLPAYDDYDYHDKRVYTHINGTEGNLEDSEGRHPDTEDLDGDTYLDQPNNYYRYKIDLSSGDNNRYIVSGLDNPYGWRLYRIPLVDTLIVGDPSFTEIEYVRLWCTGFRSTVRFQIAQMDIVGNEWQEVANDSKDDYEPLRVAVINTHDNPEYEPPEGVSGELDPATNLRTKEQSLVIKVKKLGTGEIGQINKHLYNKVDLLDYRYLKMFVHGGDYRNRLLDRNNQPLDLEMFIRIGKDIDSDYYEYSQHLNPGWSKENEIEIDMERLASLKFLREQDSLRNYDILPNGDVIRVVGSPSLAEVREIVVGVKNFGQDISEADGVEFWIDELRVSDVNRDPGWAARGSMKLEIADLMTINAGMSQQDANFHSVDSRKAPSSNREELEGTFSTDFQIGKFLDPSYGVRVPIGFKFSQSVEVPKYQPSSDIKLSALSGESVDMYSMFADVITSNTQMSDNPVYNSPIDSLVTISKEYSMSTSYGKSKMSDNFFVHNTLDRLSASLTHRESYSTDPNYLFKKSRTNTANASYNFSFDEPIELYWLTWAKNVPVINKVSESTFKPLPGSASFSLAANESYSVNKNRSGYLSERDPFGIDRSYNVSWDPISILDMSFSQSINADRIRKDSLRTAIAERFVDIDTTAYMTINPEDSSEVLDSLAFNTEVSRRSEAIEKEMFWALGNDHFVDNSMTQRFNSSIRPRFAGWLTTDASYNVTYQWSWREPYGVGTRDISAGNQISTSATLSLPQIVSALHLGTDGKDKDGNVKGSGGVLDEFGNPMDGGKTKTSSPSVDDMYGGEDPFGKGMPAPGGDDPFAQPLPSPGGEDAAEEDSLNAEKDLTPADSTKQKKNKRPPVNPLHLINVALGKLQDIRWQYSQTNSVQNYAVERGQADWAYRLGLSRDPGLNVAGDDYDGRDSYRRTDEHTLSSSLQLTRTFRFSNLSYTISKSKTTPQERQETGSESYTVWYQFKEGTTDIDFFPILNWSASWSGLSGLEFVQKYANSVSVENSFRGNRTESWQGWANPDSMHPGREPQSIDFEKAFSPLVGVSVNWKGGVTSNMRYNHSIHVTDSRVGKSTKTRNTSQSINLSANYTSRRGFKVPIPVWPFKNKKLKNSTSFALAYNYTSEKQESSAEDVDKFSTTNSSTSWSLSPSIDYSFSTTVKGGVQYEYGVQNSLRNGKVRSQELTFRVNISIRG